ncbi:hypothetical protein BSZ32_06730 [Rubritalea profundi]|uniref:Uncharacterized protein n=2 Tax=Rubritalea profundi TaxID=1658618 RepID=A0A2S7TZQ4_9BACT|nr:hypothetical protein BSZ32_06730 [Rubritalea profundi]
MKVAGSFTGRGTLVLLVLAVLTLAGFLFQEMALLRLSLLLLVVLVLAAVVASLNMRKLSVRIEGPLRVHAGKKFPLKVVLRNQRNFLDSIGLKVEIKLARNLHFSAVAPWVAAGGDVLLDLAIMSRQRACVMEADYRIESNFPFGLFHRELKGTQAMAPPILIYPKKIVPRELMMQGALIASELDRSSRFSGEFGDLRGLRPWQSGDSAKHIDWPASAKSLARGHELRVREFDPPGFYTEHCDIVFHSFGKGGAILREDRFERALAFLAGTMDYLYSLGVKFTLHADFLAWLPQAGDSRNALIEIYALLAQATRATGTEAHEVQSVIDSQGGAQTRIILSDIETESWVDSLEVPKNSVLVDIRQVRFGRRVTRSSKEAVHA